MSDITEKYDIISEDPLKFCLKNCAWDGIIFSFTHIDCSTENSKDVNKEPGCEFDFHIWSETQDFDIKDFSTVHQMNEFQRLLGRILKHELEKILND